MNNTQKNANSINANSVNVNRVNPTQAGKNQFEIDDLCVDYMTDRGLTRAVNHVSFNIEKGEIFGLAGESGCGKSTIAFAISRLTRPPGIISNGNIRFHGEDVLEYNTKRLRQYRWAQVSVVFQSAMNSLNPVITINEQICDTLHAHMKISKKDARKRASELLELMGINRDRLDDYPHQFSGGMRQRIGIAIALALSPELIIMDEPTTALDVVVQREIMQEIFELKQKFGFSILFITHDLSLMVEFSDRIGVMYAGELIEIAPAKCILEKPLHPYTIALGQSYPTLTGPKVRLKGISGNPLDLNNIPEGCRFHERCEKREPRCSSEKPILLEAHQGQFVSCNLFNEKSRQG